MTVIDNLKDELYMLANSQWYEGLSDILELLCFPVKLDYICDIEEFLFERSGKLSSMTMHDREILSNCSEIAAYNMERKFKKIKIFGVQLFGSQKLRNEAVYDICKLFCKLYGRFIMLMFVIDGELAFSGIGIENEKYATVIISEWFSYKDNYEKQDKLLDIDFSYFDNHFLCRLYSDYLWAIARDYVKYSESKMYLIYGCDCLVTYETYVESQDGEGVLCTTKIDREETLRINSELYPKLYGWDYFIDDSNIEVDNDDFLNGEDDAEFEWVMLEMKLADEIIEEEDPGYFDEEDEDTYDEIDEYDEELSGLNPEEMLEYIRKRTDS